MSLLVKIEAAINSLLLWLGAKCSFFLKKITPPPVTKFIELLRRKIDILSKAMLALPKTARPWIFETIQRFKTRLANLPFKQLFIELTQRLKQQQSAAKTNSFWLKVKPLIMAPILIMGKWLQGLSATQSLLLLTFSAASILSGVNMIFSGKRLIEQHEAEGRSPASLEETVEYDRPAYYKKQAKHLELTNLRLPVFVPEINQQRTVDIDFTATLSNRMAKKFLEKHEFQLRDHFILNIEPVEASFPIIEEGREIIRQKLLLEINEFLKTSGIEDAYVTELKITYVLAN